MRTIHVPLKSNAYDIVIGAGILSRLGPRLKTMGLGRHAVIITNPVIQRKHEIGRAHV